MDSCKVCKLCKPRMDLPSFVSSHIRALSGATSAFPLPILASSVTASTSGHGYSCKPNVNLGLTAVIDQPAFSPFHSVGIIKWALRFPIDTARLHSTAGREENSAHSHSAEQCGQRQLVPRLSNWQPQASCLCLEGRLYWCVCVPTRSTQVKAGSVSAHMWNRCTIRSRDKEGLVALIVASR